jgi:hypothetical protein
VLRRRYFSSRLQRSARFVTPVRRPRTISSAPWTTADGSVRIVLNKPADFDPDRPTQLIVFATPNGNTAEQTLGAKLEPGMEWRYDIPSHVAAQVRKLRSIDPSHNLVIACVQAANTKLAHVAEGAR